MKKSSILRKLHKDNNGAGLLMVLIMVAFLGILTGILMFVTYMGYQMRLVDKQGKDNFYTAETVLDEINVGLQAELSVALTEAYKDVMRNYSIYSTSEERVARFNEKYVNILKAALEDPSTSGRYNIDMLRGYVSESLLGDGAEGMLPDGSSDKFGSYGAVIESNLGADIFPLVNDGKGLVLSDLKIIYVNKSGYVSIITTDLRLSLPDIKFPDNTSTPDLNKYCIIADSGLKAGNTVAGGSVEITGDVYADSMIFGKQTLTDSNGNFIELQENNEVIFKADNGVGAQNLYATIVSKGNVEIKNAKLTTSKVNLWGQNIILDSADVNLNGNTYVQNDMKINGDGSKAVLEGTYTGFSDATETVEDGSTGIVKDAADNSSAIIINGHNSSLDFSALNSLNIGGHAFIGTSSQGLMAGVNDDGVQMDILMGESVAVKSNQLIYLVPPEALGCEILEDGTIGDSVYRSNPMRLEQYMEIKNNPEKYVLIDADRKISVLGNNHKLSEYMLEQTISGEEKAYRPIIIVKQTNEDSSLVYCYMQFKDRNAANAYFRDYYNINAESVEKYTRIYAEAIKMPELSEELVYLHLAGNVLTYDEEGGSDLYSATDSEESIEAASGFASIRADMYQALISKMSTDISTLTVEEQSKTVYKNTVKTNGISRIVEGLRTSSADDTVIIETSDGLQAAVFCTGDYTIGSEAETPSKVALVVCEGNVYVKRDFKGTIIAGGEVIICDSNDYDRKVKLETIGVEDFNRLMQASAVKDGTEYYVYDAFKDGDGYINNISVSVDNGTKEVNLSELIKYERWSKQ